MNICCFIPLRNIYLLVRLALRILGCGAVSLPEAQISNDDDNKSITRVRLQEHIDEGRNGFASIDPTLWYLELSLKICVFCCLCPRTTMAIRLDSEL